MFSDQVVVCNLIWAGYPTKFDQFSAQDGIIRQVPLDYPVVDFDKFLIPRFLFNKRCTKVGL